MLRLRSNFAGRTAMHITMVKKRLENGEPCQKCAQAEDILRRRGLWARIDQVVTAHAADPASPGFQLAPRPGVDLAPLFIVNAGGSDTLYTSALELIAEVLSPKADVEEAPASVLARGLDATRLAVELEGRRPQEIVNRALELFGNQLALAFSGAEDVVLVDMAVKSGRPFSVFTLDTGRLAPETYEFIERVRKHYGIAIHAAFPRAEEIGRAHV